MTTTFTAQEVSKHNTKSDIWVTIHSNVYDITPYLEDHPGGVPILVEIAGQDATTAFEELGHSEHAREVLERYLVGKLDEAEDDAQSPTIMRQLAPEPATPAKSLLDTAIIIAVAEVLSMSAIVTISFIIAQRIGGFAFKHATWSIPSVVGGLLPWLTSTTMASMLMKTYVRRKFPTPAPAKRPAHFKVDNTMIVSKPKPNEAVLKAGQFIDLPIKSIEKLSRNSNKLVLELPKSCSRLGLPIGQHITIRNTIQGEEVSRSYTPTSSNKDLGRLELVIKNYDDGLLTGQYLKDVKVGDALSISGPKGQMHYRRGLAQTLSMIAGGTGVTPMYQLIRAICEDPLDNTNIVLIYTNQSEEDVLLKAELDTMVAKHGDQLNIHYILSQPGVEWSGRVGRCTQALCQEVLTSGNDKQNKAMVCGPPGMVESAKQWLTTMGYEPAKPISRMRDQVFVF